MSIKTDAEDLLRAIAAGDNERATTTASLHRDSFHHWTAQRFNDAIKRLVKLGYIEDDDTGGSHPYEMNTLSTTLEGREALETLAARIDMDAVHEQNANARRLLGFLHTRSSGATLFRVGLCRETLVATRLSDEEYRRAVDRLVRKRIAQHMGTGYGITITRYGVMVAEDADALEKELPLGASMEQENMSADKKVFIGHGRSAVWRDLKDFIQDRLKLTWEEFNRESAAGKSTKERLVEMLDASCFAFLVMTAEDEYADGTKHARANVIHEAGLFQGRLGFERAIILLEEGCDAFSNIHGITWIEFPKGKVSAIFEEVRKVLEREGIIPTSGLSGVSPPGPFRSAP